MKVLHYQHMGVGVILSAALQELGVESRVLSSVPHPFGFEADYLLPRRSRLMKWMRYYDWQSYRSFDILHSHDNYPVIPYVWAHWQGRLIQHYHDPKTTKRIYPKGVPSFVSLPNILKVIPEAKWLPIPIETNLFSPGRKTPHEGTRIGYNSQTIDLSKSAYIPLQEIKEGIRRSGKTVILMPLQGIHAHQQMTDYYSEIDLWVDRIGHDFYGFSALEAASMGIAIVTQIGVFEKEYVPDCPFHSVQRDQVAGAIADLISDQEARTEIGRKNREFVLRRHDAHQVANTCLEQYRYMEGNHDL